MLSNLNGTAFAGLVPLMIGLTFVLLLGGIVQVVSGLREIDDPALRRVKLVGGGFTLGVVALGLAVLF